MCKVGDFIVLLFLLLCSISDLRTRKISTMLLVIMSLFMVLLCLFFKRQGGGEIVGGVLIGIVFWLISKYSNETIGYGDSWIISLMGIYLGGICMLEIVVTAFFLTGFVSLMGIVFKKWKNSVTLPFIPFLTVSYLGVLMI